MRWIIEDPLTFEKSEIIKITKLIITVTARHKTPSFINEPFSLQIEIIIKIIPAIAKPLATRPLKSQKEFKSEFSANP